jgi:hypothetical protein
MGRTCRTHGEREFATNFWFEYPVILSLSLLYKKLLPVGKILIRTNCRKRSKKDRF